jgi:Ser/Thr protein kinase RdoA (MazF antagonist)
MRERAQPANQLSAFGLDPSKFRLTRITAGHINQTFKVEGEESFVLQRINIQVFRKPDVLASNLRLAANFLKQGHPEYQFLSPLQTMSGEEMVWDDEGYPWRMFPYIADTLTVNEVESAAQAKEASAGFARLSRYLDGIDVAKFGEPIPDFHNLSWRYRQFEQALAGATLDRKQQADTCIRRAREAKPLVDEYDSLIKSGRLVSRVMHNDTKINNILFHQRTGAAVCVIDLDTLGPGYFIYDLGDMVRTFVSPVSEEEKDLARVVFREPIYDALLEGYLGEMGAVLSEGERGAIPFAGKMMTAIMAYRFLADFLNGDVYYHTTYPGQNLVRASNQFRLLEVLETSL